MKRLAHEQAGRNESVRDIAIPKTRWGRFKEWVAGGALVTAAMLGFGGCATTSAIAQPVTPPTARPAQSAQPPTTAPSTVDVYGTQVQVITLTDTVGNLDQRSSQYRGSEVVEPSGPNAGRYSTVLIIPRELAATVFLHARTAEWQNSFGITYPRAAGGDPVAPNAEIWGVALDGFARAIKQVTGQDLTRVKLIVERSTDTSSGEPVVSVYALAVDSQGSFIGRYGGGYLSVGGTFFTQTREVGGGMGILVEPAPRETPIASAR